MEQWVETEAGPGSGSIFHSSKKPVTGTVEAVPKHQSQPLLNEFGRFHDAGTSFLALLLPTTSGFGSFSTLCLNLSLLKKSRYFLPWPQIETLQTVFIDSLNVSSEPQVQTAKGLRAILT